MVREILLLGDPRLYEVSEAVTSADAGALPAGCRTCTTRCWTTAPNTALAGPVAAPQIGVRKRLIYMLLDRPYVLVNPVLSFQDSEEYELLDDCMSFPGLAVKVKRHRRCVLEYSDEGFERRRLELEGDLSELVQHEYDHLDGILATMRAVDDKSLYMMQLKRGF